MRMGNTLGSEGNIERANFECRTFENDILQHTAVFCNALFTMMKYFATNY